MDEWQHPALDFLRQQSTLTCSSCVHWTGRQLLQGETGDLADRLFETDFAVLS